MPIESLASLLTPAELDALRAAYRANPGELADLPLDRFGILHPGGTEYFRLACETFYTNGPAPGVPPKSILNETWREVALLTVLAGQRLPLQLAIHVYWALMHDLSVDQICELMLLVGVYYGISVYTQSLGTVQVALSVLKANAKSGRVEPLAVFEGIIAAFGPKPVGASEK
jgi:alkylhydroperoxidase/carboxymuconolactone decarboxylase family protein YurZ